MIVTYGPLLLLLVFRLLFSIRFPLSEEESYLAGFYLLNALFAAVFFSRIRFRLPVDWLMLLLDAGMITSIISRLSSADWQQWRKQKQLKRLAEAESAALRSARVRLSEIHMLEQQ